MIYQALLCLAEDLNDYFKIKLHIKEEKFILSGIMNLDGSVAIDGENKMIITLVNVEKESTVSGSNNIAHNRPVANAPQPVYINLYVLFSAYFKQNNYTEALRFLTYTIEFLQGKNVFTHSNTPSLDKGIEKISFELENTGAERLNNLWATIGAKYMPSVLYKVRMLTIDSSMRKEYRPAISTTDAGNKTFSS